MGQTIIQVDAFTNQPFTGNPAAVCILDGDREDRWMQNVAQEMNLSETAFLVKQDPDGFSLRWFTPITEVPLCGHATLASAHVLWSEGHLPPDRVARFWTKSRV
jgi:PhzF family phenazine biosynthesis protein